MNHPVRPSVQRPSIFPLINILLKKDELILYIVVHVLYNLRMCMKGDNLSLRYFKGDNK